MAEPAAVPSSAAAARSSRTRTSLRTRLIVSVSALLATLSLVLLVFFTSRSDGLARTGAERKGIGIATVLASGVAAGLEFDDASNVEGQLAQLQRTPEAVFASVHRADGTRLAVWNPHLIPPVPVKPPAEPQVVLTQETLRVLAPVNTRGGETGSVLVGFSLATLNEDRRANFSWGLVASLLAVALGLILSTLLGTYIVRPIQDLADVTLTIVEDGRLSQRIVSSSRADEVGELATSFQLLLQKLHASYGTIGQTARHLGDVLGQISRTSLTVAQGSTQVRARTESTTRQVMGMISTMDRVASRVSALHERVEHTASNVTQMDAVNSDVRQSVATMTANARAVSVAIEAIATSSREIADNVSTLHSSAGASTKNATQMNASSQVLAEQTRLANNISERMSQDAQLGNDAVVRTLDGLDRIKQSSENGARVITTLGSQISRIDSIVSVIQDVAEQTQLLSLNANIIAAQAGESGRSFSVVADEIRNLAERTRNSAEEIGAVIRAIQRESDNATQLMGESLKTVSVGVTLGRETQRALETIVSGAESCSRVIQQIATAADSQSTNVRQVTRNVEEIAQGAERINKLTKDQASSAQEIRKNTQTQVASADAVRKATLGQEESSRSVGEALMEIRMLATELNGVHKQQAADSRQVMVSTEDIQQTIAEHSRSAAELQKAVKLLQTQAVTLRAQIGAVRLD